jgi:hypothetical protein
MIVLATEINDQNKLMMLHTGMFLPVLSDSIRTLLFCHISVRIATEKRCITHKMPFPAKKARGQTASDSKRRLLSMKRFVTIFLLSLLVLLLALPCAAVEGVGVVAAGVSDSLTADFFEEALGLSAGTLRGVTVCSLPVADAGRLICEGVAVEKFDYLPRESLDWLVFESFAEETSATFSILPDTAEDCVESTLTLVSDPTLAESVFLTDSELSWRRAAQAYFSAVWARWEGELAKTAP